jgi:hypothetical protein
MILAQGWQVRFVLGLHAMFNYPYPFGLVITEAGSYMRTSHMKTAGSCTTLKNTRLVTKPMISGRLRAGKIVWRMKAAMGEKDFKEWFAAITSTNYN